MKDLLSTVFIEADNCRDRRYGLGLYLLGSRGAFSLWRRGGFYCRVLEIEGASKAILGSFLARY